MWGALTAPVWQSIVPQLVPRQDLSPAVAANSVGVNVSRAVGPALGGVMAARIGIAAPFWFNAVSNLAVVGALLWWHPREKGARLPVERFGSAIRIGFRHARNNPHLRATLVRAAAFFLFASAYWALLPLVARTLRASSSPGNEPRRMALSLAETFFDGFTNPRNEFLDAISPLMADALLLVGKLEIQKDTKTVLGRIQARLSKVERVIKVLSEPIDFFQPASLTFIGKWANKNDEVTKRKYEVGLMSITLHKDRTPITIHIPKTYRVPSLEPLQKFRAALAGFKIG